MQYDTLLLVWMLSIFMFFQTQHLMTETVQFFIYCVLPSDGLWARWPGFKSQQGQDLSVLHNVQSGSGAHSASCPVGMRGDFLNGKAAVV
jgi:hypothetical protein